LQQIGLPANQQHLAGNDLSPVALSGFAPSFSMNSPDFMSTPDLMQNLQREGLQAVSQQTKGHAMHSVSVLRQQQVQHQQQYDSRLGILP
jgi:hypothetical protein